GSPRACATPDDRTQAVGATLVRRGGAVYLERSFGHAIVSPSGLALDGLSGLVRKLSAPRPGLSRMAFVQDQTSSISKGASTMRVTLLGAPGAGKGTQGRFIT